MTQAQTVQRKMERFAKTHQFTNASPRQALVLVHDIAFAECEKFEEAEFGYGPAKIYRFMDGSVLCDDGRGYTCS